MSSWKRSYSFNLPTDYGWISFYFQLTDTYWAPSITNNSQSCSCRHHATESSQQSWEIRLSYSMDRYRNWNTESISCPRFIKWLNLKLKPSHWNQYSRSPIIFILISLSIFFFFSRSYTLTRQGSGWYLWVAGRVGRNFRSSRVILWIVCLTCFVQIHSHRCKNV